MNKKVHDIGLKKLLPTIRGRIHESRSSYNKNWTDS